MNFEGFSEALIKGGSVYLLGAMNLPANVRFSNRVFQSKRPRAFRGFSRPHD